METSLFKEMEKKFSLKSDNRQRGVSLYLAIMILSILLAIVFGLGAILVGQIKTIRQIGYSAIAFNNANTGVEHALKNIRKDNNTNPIPIVTLGSGSSYKVDISACGANLCIKSTGTYKGIERVVEAVSHPLGFACRDSVDYAGEDYPTVLIGTQCWLAKNLNVGTMIPGVDSMTDNAIIEKYCYDDDSAHCATHGGLYQWNEAMQYSGVPASQGICPADWHIATDAEWHTLELSLKEASASCDPARNPLNPPAWDCNKAGDELKTAGLCKGRTPCGTSGFNALFAGVNDINLPYWGGPDDGETATYFFTSDETGGSCNGCRKLRKVEDGTVEMGVWRESCNKEYGFSIRCIHD
jgi:uncharacterized protein (TIGR02145 family)